MDVQYAKSEGINKITNDFYKNNILQHSQGGKCEKNHKESKDTMI